MDHSDKATCLSHQVHLHPFVKPVVKGQRGVNEASQNQNDSDDLGEAPSVFTRFDVYAIVPDLESVSEHLLERPSLQWRNVRSTPQSLHHILPS